MLHRAVAKRTCLAPPVLATSHRELDRALVAEETVGGWVFTNVVVELKIPWWWIWDRWTVTN